MPERLARILARLGLVRALVPLGLVLRMLRGDSVEVSVEVAGCSMAGCSSAAAEALSALPASVALLPAARSTVGEVRPRWT